MNKKCKHYRTDGEKVFCNKFSYFSCESFCKGVDGPDYPSCGHYEINLKEEPEKCIHDYRLVEKNNSFVFFYCTKCLQLKRKAR